MQYRSQEKGLETLLPNRESIDSIIQNPISEECHKITVGRSRRGWWRIIYPSSAANQKTSCSIITTDSSGFYTGANSMTRMDYANSGNNKHAAKSSWFKRMRDPFDAGDAGDCQRTPTEKQVRDEEGDRSEVWHLSERCRLFLC